MNNILKPEYIFNPAQAMRRLIYGFRQSSRHAMAPWGAKISFDPRELHGRAMLTFGLSDLRTCEIISRIVRPGDTCVDIGANIGIMTSLMSSRSEKNGKIYAFEPHPVTRSFLEVNAKFWERMPNMADVHVSSFAVSNSADTGLLIEPSDFSNNSGVATLQRRKTHPGDDIVGIQVDCISFDEFFPQSDPIRLVKVDVEGHEDLVLAGMGGALSSGRIDYILFEELRSLPSVACRTLEGFGYSTYLIDRTFWGPVLIPTSKRPDQLVGEATNVLAVRDSEGFGRLSLKGWTCLRG